MPKSWRPTCSRRPPIRSPFLSRVSMSSYRSALVRGQGEPRSDADRPRVGPRKPVHSERPGGPSRMSRGVLRRFRGHSCDCAAYQLSGRPGNRGAELKLAFGEARFCRQEWLGDHFQRSWSRRITTAAAGANCASGWRLCDEPTRGCRARSGSCGRCELLVALPRSPKAGIPGRIVPRDCRAGGRLGRRNRESSLLGLACGGQRTTVRDRPPGPHRVNRVTRVSAPASTVNVPGQMM